MRRITISLRRRRRWPAWLLALGLLASACADDSVDTGGSASSSRDTAAETTTTDTPAQPVEDDGVDGTGDEAGAESTVDDGTDAELAMGEAEGGAPSTLPITATYESDGWLWRMDGSAGGLVTNSGATAVLIRDGELTEVEMNDGSFSKVEAASTESNDDAAFLMGTRTTWAPANIFTTIDWGTLTVDRFVVDHGLGIFTLTDANLGSSSIGRIGEGFGVIDTATFEFVREFELDWTRNRLVIGDELWSIVEDGTIEVVDFTTGAAIGEGSLGRLVAPYSTHLWGYDDDHAYFVSRIDGEAAKVDRATFEVVEWIDLTAHLPGERATVIHEEDFFVMFDVDGPEGRWFVLSQFDPGTGEVVGSHTVAPNDERAFRGTKDTAEFAFAQERLYVRDHQRRIVEVDLERWGDPSTGPWTDPDLPLGAVIATPDEAALAELMIEFLADGDDDIPRTDPALSARLSDTTVPGFPDDDAWIGSVDVFGDRAFVTSYVGDEAVPMIAFDRLDDAWALDSVTECWLLQMAAPFSELDCPLG